MSSETQSRAFAGSRPTSVTEPCTIEAAEAALADEIGPWMRVAPAASVCGAVVSPAALERGRGLTLPALTEVPPDGLATLAAGRLDALIVDLGMRPGTEAAIGPGEALRLGLRAVAEGGVLIGVLDDPQPLDAARAKRGRMIADLHAMMPPGSAEVERLHTAADGPGGCHRTLLVIRKAKPPPAAPAPAIARGERAEAVIPFVRPADALTLVPGMRLQDGVLVRDFATATGPIHRILVLQLAHFGDFIIALPALRRLRAMFPDAHIRLICGPWNVPLAQESHVVDEVRGYAYFPQHPLGWNGLPVEDLGKFDDAAAGAFDLATDLRVDDDTRFLLGRVDARLRCGIGSQQRFPMLDVALPTEHVKRANTYSDRTIWLPATVFTSRLPQVSAFLQDRALSRRLRGHVVFGPYVELPSGRYTASFDLAMPGLRPLLGSMALGIEIVRDQTVIAARSFRWQRIRDLGSVAADLTFDSGLPGSRFEFRVLLRGYPLGARLRFGGVRLTREESTIHPNFRPVEVHIGEQLSLLVALIEARTAPVYAHVAADTSRETAATAAIRARLGTGRVFALAPVSNSTIRNWPLGSYAALARLLLETYPDSRVMVLGAPAQAAQAAAIVDGSGDPVRVINLAGQTKWTDLPDVLRLSDLVICNNSGIGHQAASLGITTLGIYSGSHQPPEWGPRGPRARAIMAPVLCSPCGLEVLEQCMHGHACMELLTPEIVLAHAGALLLAGPAAPGST